MKIGSHISFKAPHYLPGSVRDSVANGANAMMIYLGAPQSSRRVDTSKYGLEEYFDKYKDIIKPEDIVVHAPYITNPANPEKFGFAVDFLIKDIERMNLIGAKHLVLHPGAHTKFSREESIETLIKSLKEIFDKTENVLISLETMAGKGTELGHTFEELEYIVKQVNNKRLRICLDTCHVWDSGVDIRELDKLVNKLKEFNLYNLIDVIHVNDSKNDIGSRKDRHENIGKGFIGTEALKALVNYEGFKNAIMILETPIPEDGPIYDKEIQMLK